MPRIPDANLDAIFYLYATKEDAEAGKKAGGTGFFAGVPIAGNFNFHHIYAITNRHVAIGGGYPVIRVNTLDGSVDIYEFDCSEWVAHPDGEDIAAIPFPIDRGRHKFGVHSTEYFVTKEFTEERQIGVGEGVFMVGRFLDQDGGPTNKPAVRFGHISVMPTPIFNEHLKRDIESYCVDVHSRTGFSGSPVLCYRTPGDFLGPEPINFSDKFLRLLGIHWGQFPEYWPISMNPKRSEIETLEALGFATDERVVRGVSGMTCVTPAWKILELLMLPLFVSDREAVERVFEAKDEFYSNIPKMDTSQSNLSGDLALERMLNLSQGRRGPLP